MAGEPGRAPRDVRALVAAAVGSVTATGDPGLPYPLITTTARPGC